MTALSSQQPTRTAVILRALAIVFLVLLILAPLGANLGLWSGLTGFALLAGGLIGALIILVVNAIWLLRKPAPASKRLIRQSTLLALPGLVLIIVALSSMPERKTDADGKPLMLHNVSTDTSNPPAFSDAVRQLRGDNSNPLDYTEATAETQAIMHPEVAPLITKLDPEQAFARAQQVAQSMGWEVHHADPASGTLEAVATTRWFAFKDDIVIRVQATEEGGSRVDLRSVSRVGGGDMGANASRIQQFIDRFKQA